MTRVILLEAQPRDPGVGLVTVRASTALRDTSATLIAGSSGLWLPAIAREPRFSIDIFGSELTGQLRVDYGQVGLRFSTQLGNDFWSRLIWDGAPLKLWRGEAGAPFASYVQIFDGRAGPLERDRANSGFLSLRGPEADADKPLLTAKYAGTGGIEGNSSMRGALKPWLSGIAEGVPGVLIDKVNWVWQLHGYGAIDGITAAYEGGISKGASAGDVASYAALVALTLTAGQWATCKALGLARFGGEPRMRVSFDARGAMDGASFPARAGAIAAHLLRTAGIASGKVSNASASALDSAFPFDWGAFLTQQTTAGDLVRKAMADIAGYAFADGSGVWRFGRWRLGKTPTVLRKARDQIPLVRNIRQQAAAAPVGEVSVGARRCWGVHAEQDISPALIEALNAATADIAIALGELDRIGADAWLHPAEKLLVIKEKAALDLRSSRLRERMVALSLSVVALDADLAALNSYLAGLSPAWNATADATAISRSSWNAAWQAAYDEIEKGEKAVSEEDAKRATWGQVDGSGKPQDNATRNVPRGPYNSATTYVRGDQVVEAGSTYQLIVDSSTGNAPPDAARWVLVAAAGTGTPGDPGPAGYSVLLSNESHVVATDADGSGGSYSAAGGTMRVYQGTTLLSPTFSIPAKTPNTSWISIDSSGNYTVTDPGVDLATATLRANIAGIDFDRTYVIAKSKQGINGPAVQLSADKQGFVFTDNVADPSSQTITLTAAISGIAGAPVFSSVPSVPLSGTGSSRTLGIADFGGHRQVTVTVTVGSLSDKITIVRMDRSTAEAGATVGAPNGTAIGGMPVEQIRQGSDTDLQDTFSTYPDLASFARAWDAAGPAATALSLEQGVPNTPGGGRLLVGGSPSGPGYLQLLGKRLIPYDAEDLYCVEWDVEFPEVGTGLLYLGIRGVDAAGNNVTGNGSYHYVAAAGLSHPSIGAVRRTYRGYFRGYGTTDVSIDAANPTPISAGVVRIAPMALLRYDAGVGRSLLHSVRLFKVADFTPIFAPYSSGRTYRQNEGVTFDGRSFVSRVDGNLGNTPPSSNTSTSFWLLTSARGAPGDAGAPGTSTATPTLYRRTTSATPPAGPAGDFTYQFASGALIENVAGAFNGWSPSIPSSGGAYRWQTQAHVAGTGATAVISPAAWAAPRILAEDGLNGRDAIPFYQDATPGSPIIGDTWLQPSTREWRRWNGSAWIPVLGAFAAQNIIGASNVAALFDVGVFTDAYIANLSASKITVGLLSAARINLDGLTLSNAGGILQISTSGVNTPQIAAGAVNRAAAVQRGSTLILNSTWQTVETVSLNTAGGTIVRLDVSGLCIIPFGTGFGGSVQYRWVRNGTTVVATGVFATALAFSGLVEVGGSAGTLNLTGSQAGRQASIDLDAGAGSGANSWQLQMTADVGGATIGGCTLLATEIRR